MLVINRNLLLPVILFCSVARYGSAGATDHTLPTTDFRPPAGAITVTLQPSALGSHASPGYLGIETENGPESGVTVTFVEHESPAANAGVTINDLIIKIDDTAVLDTRTLRETVQRLGEGTEVTLHGTREGKALAIPLTLGSASRPKVLPEKQAILGLRLYERNDGEGLLIRTVVSNSPHARAGLKSGDVLLKIDAGLIRSPFDVGISLADRKPGDVVKLTVLRDRQETDVPFKLLAEASTDPAVGPARNIWRKDVFKLAVICVEFPDIPHNQKIGTTDWNESAFSQGVYRDRSNATGQPVFGSINDYYREISNGAFRLEGRVFDWVMASKKRADYNDGTRSSSKAVLLNEAVDLILARDGNDALEGFDGFFFLYSGERFPTANRGSLYWPHRSTFQRKEKRLSYFICPEGGKTMTNISVFCHEFGHMLGLPDLYARPENPGSEGVGVWCLMATELRNGRPQHMSAWCKEKLGWIKPAVIDPTQKQKLILAPIEDSPTECFKVLIRRDGSEYLLLENRQQRGFDAGLPAPGLLIWRVVGDHPILEESHGIEGPLGPRVFLNSIPFPSASNHAFTPETKPASRSLLGGGLPVHINEITQLADGRITFTIGYQLQ